jgi:hypothetical protein
MLPSGKLLHNYGTSPFFMGTSPINSINGDFPVRFLYGYTISGNGSRAWYSNGPHETVTGPSVDIGPSKGGGALWSPQRVHSRTAGDQGGVKGDPANLWMCERYVDIVGL